MSNFVVTDVYALFMKSIKKNLLHNVKNEGGGGDQRIFEQCSKKLQIWYMRAPLIETLILVSQQKNPKHDQPRESKHVPRPLSWKSYQHCEAGGWVHHSLIKKLHLKR